MLKYLYRRAEYSSNAAGPDSVSLSPRSSAAVSPSHIVADQQSGGPSALIPTTSVNSSDSKRAFTFGEPVPSGMAPVSQSWLREGSVFQLRVDSFPV